jgi:hypothetical protein
MRLLNIKEPVKYVGMRMSLVGLLALLFPLAACSSRNIIGDQYKYVAGQRSGTLRAGDSLTGHLVTVNLMQANKDVTGSATYDARSFTVKGTATNTGADLYLTEAGCPDTATLEVRGVSDLGLTVAATGDTGCGLLSASGLLTH